MATSKNDKTPKVMDVARPGKTAPPASAKPIIVTNRPMLKRDPMVASPDGLDKPAADETPKVSRVAKPISIIAPPSASETETQPEAPAAMPGLPPSEPAVPAPTASPEPSKAATVAASPEPLPGAEANEPTPEPAVPAAPEPKPQAPKVEAGSATDADITLDQPEEEKNPEPALTGQTDTAPSSAPAPDTSSPEAQPVDDDDLEDDEESEKPAGSDGQLAPNQALDEAKRKEEEAKAALAAEQEKIIASKQYYLPISAVDQRRGVNRALIILVVIILLAVVWFDLVLDAGIIRLGSIHALTNFFAN